jgi:hypothetical protein
MRDRGPRGINHVREAQYRLRWAGVYKGRITGFYDNATRNAAMAFQRKNCLRATGNLDRASWAVLIMKTTKGLSKVPRACRATGWHLCYDRRSHQDFLFRNGTLVNVWLVRGGSKRSPTRLGNYTVFARHKYKISSLYHVPMTHFQKHSGGQGHHGSFFMADPFVGHSHGCINMYLKDAQVLWSHTSKSRLRVHVFGRWS